MPDGTVGVDSSHPTRAAAEIRCKQVDVEQALDTCTDPTRGRITLAEWVAIWETGHLFFVCAVYTHVRAADHSVQFALANGFLLLAVATLALNLAG